MKTFFTLFILLFTATVFSQNYAALNAYTKVSNKISQNRLELESEIVGSTTLPMLYKYKNEKLILNGSGLNKHHYACGLYLEIPKSDGQSVLDANEFMIIRLDMLNKKTITYDKFKKMIKKSFYEINAPHITSKLKNEIELFFENAEGIYINEGDKVDIVYDPLNGVSFYINYEEKFSIRGIEFKKAIFNIWLSEEASDKKLKKELLNGAKEYFK